MRPRSSPRPLFPLEYPSLSPTAFAATEGHPRGKAEPQNIATTRPGTRTGPARFCCNALGVVCAKLPPGAGASSTINRKAKPSRTSPQKKCLECRATTVVKVSVSQRVFPPLLPFMQSQTRRRP